MCRDPGMRMIYRLRIVSETMQSGQSSLYNLVAYRTVAPRVESPPPPPPPPVVVVVSENLDVPMEIVASHTNVREVQTQTGAAIVCACCDVILIVCAASVPIFEHLMIRTVCVCI